MKKTLIYIVLTLIISSVKGQAIDTIHFNFNQVNQILTVNVIGRIIVLDPYAIVNISNYMQADTVTIDIDFWPCSPWQMQTPFDTIVDVDLVGISAGLKILRVRTFEVADLDTVCYYRANDKWIDTAYVPFNVPIGLSEERISQIKIYPNPTNGVFFVDDQGTERTEYSLYTATGQLMLRDVLPESGIINVEQFQAGVYFLKLLVEGNLVTQKILKH